MFKKSCFRAPFGSQGFSLLKSAQQHFYKIVSSFTDKLRWEASVLVGSELLGLFVNTLTADDMYSRRSRGNFHSFFSQDSTVFFQIYKQILNYLNRKIRLRALVFPKLLSPKDVVI